MNEKPYPLKEMPQETAPAPAVERPIVHQVRAIDAHGNQRIVHAYATPDAAKNAVAMMKKSGKRFHKRYTVVPVNNDPNSHWGVHFPPPPAKSLKFDKTKK